MRHLFGKLKQKFDKDEFHRNIIALRPLFRLAENHFFEHDVDHVISGFTWERVPVGIFIWRTSVALYECPDRLKLGYGERLERPHDLLTVGWSNERQLAAEFVERVDIYREDMKKRANIHDFIYLLRSKPLQNVAIRYSYALALIISGENDLAIEQLSECIGLNWNEEFEKEVAAMIQAVEKGIARKNLLDIESYAKRRLGISQ